MRSSSSATNATTGFASTALLWLEILALAIGVLQFAFAPNTVQQPLVVALALAFLTTTILIVRTVPALQRPASRQHWIGIVSCVVYVTLVAAATGAAHSALVALYLIPLAAIALAFGRWWLVALLALVIAGLGMLLGALTPGVAIHSPEFGMLMLSKLLPGVAVALILGALIEQMQTAVQRISDLAASDPLTGLLNVRSFEDVLQQEHRKAERFGRPYTLVMVDVDNLAVVNESLGHDAGSQVIVSVAAAIGRSIRASDVAARVGGDEFIVLLSETDGPTGGLIAQRIRNNIYSSTISVANRLIRANASVGTATFPEDHLYPKELMMLVGQRMQQDRELRAAQAK
ncbi:diguanylate cyclase (GGDEF)-like protein [Povalibacter uvarum]|uniref:diguanylate cyclase n=1 Tax=Povalibacter uvarum TaxID=732238 RepID=A0A841HLA8_9GAMM|nr:GGDEF domain-containing protein [Povalibacter uvarum]MBB6093070.1 diguanylate cyclase (GGDEF)-like protein [Povalibacter uvarum]